MVTALTMVGVQNSAYRFTWPLEKLHIIIHPLNFAGWILTFLFFLTGVEKMAGMALKNGVMEHNWG